MSLITPDQITINSLDLNREKNEVEIIGRAETRDQLLKYTDSLGEFKYFKNINLPSDYLISPDNITFEITANLNGDNLISIER